jgi:hypothetical protein
MSSLGAEKGGFVGKVVGKSSEFVGDAAVRKITSTLPADHYLSDVCDLVAWMDASYVHRPDYKKLMGLTALAYEDAGTYYHRCLMEKAEERRAAGTLPPAADVPADSPPHADADAPAD